MKKKLIAWLCATSLLVCGPAAPSAAHAAKKPVSLSKNHLILKEGSSKTLKVKSIAKIKIQSKKFTTSNKKIATVSKTGKVTAKKVGKTKIKVKVTFLLSGTAKENTLSCNVTVKPKKKSASKTTTAPSVKPSAIPVNNASTIPTDKPSAVPDGAASVFPVHTASATSGSSATEPTMTAPSITNTPKPSATPNDPGATATPVPTNSNTPVSTSTPDNSNETPLPPMPAVTQPPADLRAPGLYSSEDHTTLIKSWDQLISDGDIGTGRYNENNLLREEGLCIGNKDLSGELVIADSVDVILDHAFKDCASLSSVTIPDSMTSIGDQAFFGFSGLTSIYIPNSVTSIGSNAFRDCSSLTSINIPDSITSIKGGHSMASLRSFTMAPIARIIPNGELMKSFEVMVPFYTPVTKVTGATNNSVSFHYHAKYIF